MEHWLLIVGVCWGEKILEAMEGAILRTKMLSSKFLLGSFTYQEHIGIEWGVEWGGWSILVCIFKMFPR